MGSNLDWQDGRQKQQAQLGKTLHWINETCIHRRVQPTSKKHSNLICWNFWITKQQIEEIKKEVQKKHRIHKEPTGRKNEQCRK